MTNPAAVSPLDVLRNTIPCAFEDYVLDKSDMPEAIAAVEMFAELLAADREYDEATEALYDETTPVLENSMRMSCARQRRAAAIAAFGEVG